MLEQIQDELSVLKRRQDTDLLDDKTLEHIRPERSYDEDVFVVGERTCIPVMIDGKHDQIDFSHSDSVTLGRADLYSTTLDLFDLQYYGALDNGVSRSHCKLTIKWGQLFVTDVDSTNGTYLNDKRLTPYRPYVVKKGATLRLGHLPMNFLNG